MSKVKFLWSLYLYVGKSRRLHSRNVPFKTFNGFNLCKILNKLKYLNLDWRMCGFRCVCVLRTKVGPKFERTCENVLEKVFALVDDWISSKQSVQPFYWCAGFLVEMKNTEEMQKKKDGMWTLKLNPRHFRTCELMLNLKDNSLNPSVFPSSCTQTPAIVRSFVSFTLSFAHIDKMYVKLKLW